MAVSTNLPKGTYVQDGVRTGPYYTRQIALTPLNGVLVSGNHDKYGPAVQLSSNTMWDIVPYNSTAGNIVAATAVAGASYLTFTQDGDATNLVNAPNLSRLTAGPSAGKIVQFDYPRGVSVEIAGGNMGGPVNVTIFGCDWYGFPMQTTYVVQNTGTYPNNPLLAPMFYQVWGVYFNGVTGGGITAAVRTNNTFGLPYRVKDSGQSILSWDNNAIQDFAGSATLVAGTVTVNNPAVVAGSNILVIHNTNLGTVGSLSVPSATIVPATSFVINSDNNLDVSVINYLIPNAGSNLVSTGIVGPASFNTADTRGAVRLPDIGETWANLPNGVRALRLNYYQFGANTEINQFAAAGMSQGAGTVPYLTQDDMYGVSQYYTGTPR